MSVVKGLAATIALLLGVWVIVELAMLASPLVFAPIIAALFLIGIPPPLVPALGVLILLGGLIALCARLTDS